MFTKILTSSLLFLIAIGGFFVSTDGSIVELSVSQVSAAGDQAPESDTLKKGIDAFNAVLGFITLIVSPAIIFAGWLLSPDWTSGDLFGLREPMHRLWVVVSNVIYFVYAILLIIIAVATILGKENFNYKVMLPKLALGILMVPFTWWFVQWTVSLATIVTASTVSIPLEMIGTNNPYLDGRYIPRFYVTDSTVKDEVNAAVLKQSQDACSVTGGGPTSECTSINEILGQGGGIYSTLLIYSSQVFRVQDYKKIDDTLDQVKTAGQLLNSIVVGAVMFLVFGILVIALIMVLFVRAIKLWMYAMFSPVFTLHFVAGKELFKDSDSFSLKEFVGLCFTPAIVGMILSFGLMIVSVVQNPTTTAQSNVNCTNFTIRGNNIKEVTGGCEIMSIFGNPQNKISRGIWENSGTRWSVNIVEIAGMKFVFKGTATNATDMEASSNSIRGGLSAAGGIFGTIIIDVIALIFIWMAFMAAKGVNKTISKVLDPFEQMGKKVGDMAMSAPKYAPLPIPGGSISGATKAMDQITGIQSQMADARYKESGLGKFIQSMDPSQKLSEGLEKLASAIKSETNEKKIIEMGKELQEKASGEQIKNNRDIRFAMDKFVNTLGTSVGKSSLASVYSDSRQRDAIIKIVDSKDLNPEEKRLLVGAITKGMSTTDLDSDLKKSVGKAKTYLERQSGSSGSNTSGNNGGSPDSGSNIRFKEGNMIVNINNTEVVAKSVTTQSSAEQIAEAIKNASDSKNYKNLVTRDQFIGVITSGLGGGEQGKKKAEEIANKLGNDFFKSEEKKEEEPKKS